MMDELRLHVGDSVGDVSAIFLRPDDAWAVYVLAHGAGAGMRHRFMEAIAGALAARGVATLRYQFPYMEHGSRRPTRPACSRPPCGPRWRRRARSPPTCRSSPAASRWAGA